MLTYGDGVSDIPVPELISHHKASGKLATLTAVQPSGKFGALQINEANGVTAFKEKPQGDGAWINGGYFVCEPQVFDYITEGDGTIWERGPLESIAKNRQLNAFKYTGFWKPMDTLRDKLELNEMWEHHTAPWKVWND
jgi:glucose-1-phosphate cytidylyltransferase